MQKNSYSEKNKTSFLNLSLFVNSTLASQDHLASSRISENQITFKIWNLYRAHETLTTHARPSRIDFINKNYSRVDLRLVLLININLNLSTHVRERKKKERFDFMNEMKPFQREISAEEIGVWLTNYEKVSIEPPSCPLSCTSHLRVAENYRFRVKNYITPLYYTRLVWTECMNENMKLHENKRGPHLHPFMIDAYERTFGVWMASLILFHQIKIDDWRSNWKLKIKIRTNIITTAQLVVDWVCPLDNLIARL